MDFWRWFLAVFAPFFKSTKVWLRVVLQFRGIRLRMTINFRLLEWVFQLQQPLQLDPERDVRTHAILTTA